MLYIMRHGKTDWNAVHRLQGSEDIPLNEEIIKKLEAEEETNLVIKMNAGKANENIKHSKETLDELDEYLGVKELSFTKSNSYVNI